MNKKCRCSKPLTCDYTQKLAYHLSRINPFPAWTNFFDPNLLPLLWLIDSGAQIPDSMKIPCFDGKAIHFLKEANTSFKLEIDIQSNKVNI